VALPILQKYNVPATVFVSTNYIGGGIMWNDMVIESIRRASPGSFALGDFGLPEFQLDDNSNRSAIAVQLIDRIKYFSPHVRSEVTSCLSQQIDLPKDLMLSSEQVLKLSNSGIEIGAHTCSHPILTEISAAEALSEIRESKAVLEGLIGKSVAYFAYPNGKPGRDYSAAHREMVKSLGFSAAVSTHDGVADITSDKFQLPRFTPWDRSKLKFIVRMAMNARNVYRGIE
jgi:peptidoglycan/xylan/chitin deacetylase (PgdA/CDA1 family)